MEQLLQSAPETVTRAQKNRLILPDVTRLTQVAQLHAHTVLRVALGVVFLWFGILKFTPLSPVAQLVADTVPFVPAKVLIPALATFEVLVGIGLLVGRWTAAVAAVMIAHLMGTFLVLVIQPAVAFQNGNPLELTMTGEFVVKNVVLIAAGLVLIGRRPVTSDSSD